MDSPLINIMVKAAKKASRGLRRDFNELENYDVEDVINDLNKEVV